MVEDVESVARIVELLDGEEGEVLDYSEGIVSGEKHQRFIITSAYVSSAKAVIRVEREKDVVVRVTIEINYATLGKISFILLPDRPKGTRFVIYYLITGEIEG